MKKLLLLLFALFTTIGTWATVTMPTLTTDVNNPVLYCIQSYRSYGFVKYADGTTLTQTLDYSDANTKFYFVPVNGTDYSAGVKIVSNVNGKQINEMSGFADTGTTWYFGESSYASGCFNISKTSSFDNNSCWDCNAAGGMTAAYWHANTEGSTWKIYGINDLPQFETSTLENPKWYYIQSGRNGRYLYADGTNAGTTTNNPKSEPYKFAFISTGNNKIQIVSKAGKDAGSNQYLSTEPGLTNTATDFYYYNVARSEGYFSLAYVELSPNANFGYDGNFRLLHIGNGGNLTSYYSHADAGNWFRVEEVLPVCDVTYTYTYGGQVYSQTETQNIGDPVSLPASIKFPYTNYSFDADVVPDASTATVNVTVESFSMPFTASTDYANATWYYMNGHAYYNNYYISTNGTAVDFKTGMSRTDAYKWAFIGNPIEGIKVINKASGDGYYIIGTNPATMGTTDKAWTLKQQTTTTWSSGTRGFGLYDSSLGYLNCRTAANNIQYWTALDQGSTFWVEEIDATTSDKNALAGAITTAQILVASPNVPGYPSTEAASTLSSAITAAQSVYDDAAGDYAAAYNTLIAAINTAKEAIVYIPRTDVYYTITSSRGSMVYDPSHDSSTDAEGNKFLWYTTSLDNTDVNQLWGFIEQDGKYYMYNVGRKQFATVSTTGGYQLNDKGTWIFSETPAYVTFDKGINNSVAAPYVRVRATVATTETTYSMSISTGYTGPVITYDAQGDGGIPMMIATSAVAVDPDITAEMTAKVADPTPYRNALKDVIDGCELIPFGTGVNQYAESSAYSLAFAAANITYEDADATIGELQTATQNLESAIAGLSLNLPATGKLYRIKGYSNNYITSGVSGYYASMDGTESADNIVYYNEDRNLIFYGTGYGLYNTCIIAPVGSELNSYTFSEGAQKGHYYIRSNASGDFGQYCYDHTGSTAGDILNRNGSPVTSGSYQTDWTLEEVNSLPLSIAADSYASFSAPVAVTIPDDCYAYIATGEETDVVNMTKVTGDVAANTGLIISTVGIDVTGPLSFDIAESGTEYANNLLVANVAATDVSTTNNYFFGQVGGNYVFTLLSGDTYTLPGHKAYLNLSGTSARLSINWGSDDSTGLNELSNENVKLNDGKYYQNGAVVIVRNGVKYNVAGQTIK